MTDWSMRPVPSDGLEDIVEWMDDAEVEIYRLQKRLRFLNCLETVGVDNWEGYEQAQELME